MKESFTRCHTKRVDTPAGYIASGRMHYYKRDHQGNVLQVTESDGNETSDYRNYSVSNIIHYGCMSSLEF